MKQTPNPDKKSGKATAAEENKAVVLTKAEAASKVKRMVPVIDQETKQPKRNEKTGEIIGKPQAIKAEEVMSHAVYEDKNLVVVVTRAGEKLSGELKPTKK